MTSSGIRRVFFLGGRPNLMFERPLDLENPIMK